LAQAELASMATAPPNVGVLFSLGNADTRFGEVIRVVGAHSALGCWDPQRSVALATDADAYPCWSTTQVVWVLATDTTLEYKYLRDRRALGEGISWEDRIANRRVVLPAVDSKTGVWLVRDQAWDHPGAQGYPTPIEGVQPPQQQAPEVKKVPLEWSKAGDWTPAVANACAEYFTPSWRTLSNENILPLQASVSSSELLRRNSASLMSQTDQVQSTASPLVARELSILSLGLQRTQSSLSVIDGDGTQQESSPKLVRELSVCSLSLGLHKVASAGLLQQGGTTLGDAAPPGTSEALASSTPSTREHSTIALPSAPAMQAEGRQVPTQAEPASGNQSGVANSEARTFEDAYSIVGDNPLGEGSFGLVWRCRPRQGPGGGDDAMLAAKRIMMSKLLPRDVRNLFGHDDREGEIRMHQALKHPHIIELHEVFREPDTVSLVMECCRGGDLFDLIAANCSGLPEQSVALVERHLLKALEFLHGRRIVHRDVKCENVLMLDKDLPVEKNTFKLCDFGFAARLKADGELSTRMGSPDTVAPEIVRGERYSTPVDCWAAGVLMYMALSARPPFWAKTDVEVLKRVGKGEYSTSGGVWERISKEAKEIVSRLMTFNPRARVSATEALAYTWLGV